MENLTTKKLGFFMNYFSSLQHWDKFGMFPREILLYNDLAKKFGKVYIFTYGNSKELDYAEFFEKNVVIVPKKLKVPDVVYEFLLPFIHHKLIRECDILKTNQNSGTIAPTIAKIIYGKKLIARSGYIGSEKARLANFPLYAKLYFWFAENVSYFFCDKAFISSQSGFDILTKKYPFVKNKLVIMNNFVDIDLFKKSDEKKTYDIIYVARFDGTQKNHDVLLRAVEGLGLKLLFIGQGEEKERIAKMAEEKNINLEIIERVSNVELPYHFNSARICAFPSKFEGNPKTLLEAMSCELPVVAFDVVGVGNLIEHEKSGLISEISDQKMRTNILRLLEKPELGVELGKNARQFVIENFSSKMLFSKEIEIYQKLLLK